MPDAPNGQSMLLLLLLAAAALLLVLLYRQVRSNRQLGRQIRHTEASAREAMVQLEEVTRELLARNAEFSAIMDNVPVELVLKDLEGRYLMVNRHFEQLNGVTGEAVRGKLPQEVYLSASATTLHGHDMRVLMSDEAMQAEIVQDTEDDAWTFLYTGFPVRGPEGEVTGLGAIATDITQLKQSEAALKRLNAELEARVEARTAELSAMQEDRVRRERLAAIG
jgi:PAS domain S-box-containing protein